MTLRLAASSSGAARWRACRSTRYRIIARAHLNIAQGASSVAARVRGSPSALRRVPCGCASSSDRVARVGSVRSASPGFISFSARHHSNFRSVGLRHHGDRNDKASGATSWRESNLTRGSGPLATSLRTLRATAFESPPVRIRAVEAYSPSSSAIASLAGRSSACAHPLPNKGLAGLSRSVVHDVLLAWQG